MDEQVTSGQHRPTKESRRTVELLSGYGVPQAHIAREIGTSVAILRKRYREELDNGLQAANAKVAEALSIC
jgi:hypothetical protein